MIDVGKFSLQVCSDRALGHNFNAVTCESCKAFFRRNAISNKKFSCPFSNSCEITVITRRFCQLCRLEKCFRVGMKKEYIMSEEEKELKRVKIEQNRNKRKLKTGSEKMSSGDELEQVKSKKSIRVKEEWSPASTSSPMETQSECSTNLDSDDFQVADRLRNITSDSTVQEIVDAITFESTEASQVLQMVMKTQTDALNVMSKIIQDRSQALKLISHLIKHPSDGMTIINKMMSSPVDALSVFTQFMASPTDAFQIILKVMSSPKDVLSFMTELVRSPQNALDIMRRFMSTPTDTFGTINRMIATNVNSTSEMIQSMLEVSSVESPNSSVASPSSAFQSNSPFDTNNNDYRHNTTKLLQEISQDVGRNSIDSIINEAIKLEYEMPQAVSQQARELNDVEVMKIQELLDSNKALYAPVDEDLSSLLLEDCQIKAEPGVDPNLLKVINLTAIAIRRLIKMSKKISGFKKMCQEDQIALLKVSGREILRRSRLLIISLVAGRLHGNDDSAERHAVRHGSRVLEDSPLDDELGEHQSRHPQALPEGERLRRARELY